MNSPLKNNTTNEIEAFPGPDSSVKSLAHERQEEQNQNIELGLINQQTAAQPK